MAENKKLSQENRKVASVHNYHELQMSAMKFDAHSAFIAPTHRKRLRCFWSCQNEKKQKRGGGGGGAIKKKLKTHKKR